MPGRRLSRALIACAALVLAGTSALGGAVEDEVRRLDDLAYFTRELGRGHDPLLVEIDRTLAELRAGTAEEADLLPALQLRDGVAWEHAERLFGTEDEGVEERCRELYESLAAGAVDESRRNASSRRLADLAIRRGQRFESAGNEAAAFVEYVRAVDHAPDYEAGYEKVGRLGISQADALAAAQDFERALETLTKVLERLEVGPAAVQPRIAEASARRDSILASTGVLNVVLIGDASRLESVRGGSTDFRDGTVNLEPLDGGAVPPEVVSAVGRRVRAAHYRATVTGAGGDATVVTEVTVEPGDNSVVAPVLIPDGMVWVPGAGGAPSFLCDRTEVSNADYDAFVRAEGGRSLGGAADLPAAGVPFGDAERFARWAGKELPSLARWTHAAFGSPNASSPRYPWGDREGTKDVHFFGGRTAPGPVDGCPAGASPAGVLNMAGNVFEWLSDGWFIGGGYSATTFGRRQNYANPVDGETSWMADFLRDKVPTPEIYEGLPPDLKNRHNVYRVTSEQAEAFLSQVGFRCVIPLE